MRFAASERCERVNYVETLRCESTSIPGLFFELGKGKTLASAGLFCNPIGSFKLSIESFKSIIYS